MKNSMFTQKAGLGVFALAFAASLLLVLTGCPNPLRTPDVTDGTISLTIEQPNIGRAIQPNINLNDFVRFEVEFTRGSQTFVAQAAGVGTGNVTATATLPAGGDPWNFIVRAFLPGSTDAGVLAAQTTGSVTVTAAGANINATLLPITDGVGTFAWNLVIPPHITVDYGKIAVLAVDADGNVVGVDNDGNILNQGYVLASASENLAGESVWEGSLPNLNAGSYAVLVRLYYDDNPVAVSSMDLHVYRNMVSLWQYEFFAVVNVNFRAGDGAFYDGLGFRRVVVLRGGTVVPPQDPEREGYAFVEWNTTLAGTGTTLTEATRHYVGTDYFAIWEQTAFEVIGSWDFHPGVPPTPGGGFNTWNIQGEIIAAMRAADPGSQLRLNFDATGGTGGDRSNWGIGNIGVPPEIIALTAPTGAEMIYRIAVEADWLLDILGNDGEVLLVRTHAGNGDMLTRVELLEPIEPRVSPPRPSAPEPPAVRAPDPEDGILVGNIQIDTTGGNIATGMGNIDGAELQKILNTITAAYAEDREILLRIYVRNVGHATATGSWGVGQLNGVTGLLMGTLLGTDRHNDISQAQFLAVLDDGYSIFVNVYNQHVITLVELWTVPIPGDSITIMLGDTPVEDIVVQGTGGNVTQFQDATGYRFSATNNHRAGYAWFRVDLGDRRLSDFAYLVFDYDVRVAPDTGDGSAGRRIALIARSEPFVGNLVAMPGATTGQLGLGQVSAPMLTVIPNAEFPREVTLDILPLAAAALDAHSVLYFSIYEHTVASTVEVSNIRFIERDPACIFCGVEDCTQCDIDIAYVMALIAGLDFAAPTAAHASTQAAARALVVAAINALDLRYVSVTVDDGVFTAATEDEAGSFTFTVTLRKGNGTPETSGTLTLTIPPTGVMAPFPTDATMADFVTFIGLADPVPAWLNAPLVENGTIEQLGTEGIGAGLLQARDWGWVAPATAPTWVNNDGSPALRVSPMSGNHGVWINVAEIPVGAEMVITGRGGTNATQVLLNTGGSSVANQPATVSVATGETFSITASVEWLNALRATWTAPNVPRNRHEIRLIATPHANDTTFYVDNITIIPVPPAVVPPETVVFDFRTTDFDLNLLTGTGGQGATRIPFLQRDGGGDTATTFIPGPPRLITVTGRGGVGQALRFTLGTGANSVPAQAGYTYRFEYSGVFPGAGGTPRIRFEGGSRGGQTHDGANVAAGVHFTHYIEMSAADVMAGGTLSMSANPGSIDITYTSLRVIRIPPGNGNGNVYVFNLQTYLASLELDVDIRPATGNLASTHPAEAVTITVREGGTPGPRYVHVDRQQANATRGLLLRNVGLQAGDILFISGRLLTGDLDMRLQGQAPTFMPDIPELNRVGGAMVDGSLVEEFTITYTVAGDIVGNDVRILPHNQGIAAQFHIYDITVTRGGN